MNGFITKSGSVYHITQDNRIYGGNSLPRPIRFNPKTCRMFCGYNGYFELEDGRQLRTSVIEKYF